MPGPYHLFPVFLPLFETVYTRLKATYDPDYVTWYGDEDSYNSEDAQGWRYDDEAW